VMNKKVTMKYDHKFFLVVTKVFSFFSTFFSEHA